MAESVAAARQGDQGVVATLRQAAEECGTEPESWQHRVVEGVLDLPVDSLELSAFRNTVPAMATVSPECRALGVQAWVRAALDADVPETLYREMLGGLGAAGLVGYLAMSDLADDPEADAEHRLWVVETLVRSSRPRGAGLVAELPAQMAQYYLRNGLPSHYVETWLPMLLAAIETRESAAQQLMGLVSLRPEMEGAADIVRIVGADVEAHDYRFSRETRSRVAGVLESLAGRPGMPAAVDRAVREAMTARSRGLDHRGVLVQLRPLEFGTRAVADGCEVSWPRVMAPVVEATAPGFVAAPRRGGCEEAIRTADFNGDGLQDAIVRGVSEGVTVLLAVIAGPSPSAHVIDELRSNDYAIVVPPGTSRPACDAVGTQIFPSDYISISYDEKYSANFRFSSGGFDELMGDEC